MKIEETYSFLKKFLAYCWQFLSKYFRKKDKQEKSDFKSSFSLITDPAKIKKDLVRLYDKDDIQNIGYIIEDVNQQRISINIHKKSEISSDKDLFLQSMLEGKIEIFKILLNYFCIDVNHPCSCESHKFEHSLFIHAMLNPNLLWAAKLLINEKQKADFNYVFYLEKQDEFELKNNNYKYNILLYLIEFCPDSESLKELIENGDNRLDFDSEYQGFQRPPLLQAIFYHNDEALRLLVQKKQKQSDGDKQTQEFFAVDINQTKFAKINPFTFAFQHKNYSACRIIKDQPHFDYQKCQEYIEKFEQISSQDLGKVADETLTSEVLEKLKITTQNIPIIKETADESKEKNNSLEEKGGSEQGKIVTSASLDNISAPSRSLDPISAITNQMDQEVTH